MKDEQKKKAPLPRRFKKLHSKNIYTPIIRRSGGKCNEPFRTDVQEQDCRRKRH